MVSTDDEHIHSFAVRAAFLSNRLAVAAFCWILFVGSVIDSLPVRGADYLGDVANVLFALSTVILVFASFLLGLCGLWGILRYRSKDMVFYAVSGTVVSSILVAVALPMSFYLADLLAWWWR